jgi:hypothetical protein
MVRLTVKQLAALERGPTIERFTDEGGRPVMVVAFDTGELAIVVEDERKRVISAALDAIEGLRFRRFLGTPSERKSDGRSDDESDGRPSGSPPAAKTAGETR